MFDCVTIIYDKIIPINASKKLLDGTVELRDFNEYAGFPIRPGFIKLEKRGYYYEYG